MADPTDSTTAPTPTAPDADEFAPLKASPLWELARKYAERRVRGAASEADKAKAEAAQLREQAGLAVQGQQQSMAGLLEAEELRAATDGYLRARFAALPPALASLCPPSLSPAARLQWLAENHQTLAAIAGEPGRAHAAASAVFGGQPRPPATTQPPPHDHVKAAADRLARRQAGRKAR